jgi:hypothetical protein
VKWALGALSVLVLQGCCFFYPGDGECDPSTFVNHCADARTAVNCTDVTPVGYGMGVIPRYASLRTPCSEGSVCIMANVVAACVVDPPTECATFQETRCVDGVLHACFPVGSTDLPDELRWIDRGTPCDDAPTESAEESTQPAQ